MGSTQVQGLQVIKSPSGYSGWEWRGLGVNTVGSLVYFYVLCQATGSPPSKNIPPAPDLPST